MKIIGDFFKYNKLYSRLISFLSILLGFLNFYSLYLIFEVSSFIVEKNEDILGTFVLFAISLLVKKFAESVTTYLINKKTYLEEKDYFTKIYLDKPLSLVDSENANYQRDYSILANFLKDRRTYFISLANIIKGIAYLISVYVFIFNINFYLFLIFIISALLYIPINIKVSQKNKAIWPEYMGNMRVSNIIDKILIDKDHLYERNLFNFKDYIQVKFSKSFDKGSRSNRKLGKSKFILEAILLVLSILTTGVSILLSACLDQNSSISFSKIILILSLKLGADEVIQNILADKDLFNQYNLALDIMDKLVLKPRPNNEDRVKEEFSKYKIDFKNVYFSYPGSNKYTLEDFSYTFTSGISYLIIGENGAGKSTLIKLLLGLYEPTKGEVTINGIPTYSLSSQDKRNLFSILLQDSSKYPFTIKDNIDLSVKAKTSYSEDILKLAKKFPHGLQANLSKLDDSPVDLSGGQWQKVFMERVYKDKNKVLILDEPTASLDPISELNFYKNIDKFTDDNLSIFISHRMGIVSICDKILVLKDNKLFEEGTFDELMDKKEEFYGLYQAQKKLYK